jgi:hypothetical protein
LQILSHSLSLPPPLPHQMEKFNFTCKEKTQCKPNLKVKSL